MCDIWSTIRNRSIFAFDCNDDISIVCDDINRIEEFDEIKTDDD